MTETKPDTGPEAEPVGMGVAFSVENFVLCERVMRQVPGVGEIVFFGTSRYVVEEVAWFLDDDDPVADVRLAETPRPTPGTTASSSSSVAAGTGGWIVHGHRTLYEHPALAVQLLEVDNPAGQRYEHHAAVMRPVALALVVNDRDEVLLLWKYRFVVDAWGYEMPGGIIDPGETPPAAAARETREETGWRPVGDPEPLLTLDPFPGQLRARTTVTRWRGAQHEGDPTDPEEAHTVVEWVPTRRVHALVAAGHILGSSTAAALLHHASTSPAG